MATETKVPITVVTGFLGAGKTTLINHILKGQCPRSTRSPSDRLKRAQCRCPQPSAAGSAPHCSHGSGSTSFVAGSVQAYKNHGKRIAVVENEYGEVGIDDALVMESKEEIFELNNGCVCCTVRGDLIRILSKLLRRRNKFDHIMIETTGLANPAPVIQTFFVDDDLKESTRLDAVVTVVDARHLLQHLDEKKPDGVVNEAELQVAFADRVLLNKTDLVSKAELDHVKRRIKAINAGTDIIECSYAKVDLDRVLGIHAFSLDRLLVKDPDFLDNGSDHEHDHHHHHDHDHDHDHKEGEHCDKCDHDDHHHHHKEGEHCQECEDGHDHHHHHGHHLDHKHDSAVSSVGITAEGDCNMQRLNAWLSELLKEKGADLFRSKGILSIAGSDDRHVFQGVHMLLQFTSSAEGVGRPWAPGEKRVNKVVFIGKHLNRQELTDGFMACLVNKAN